MADRVYPMPAPDHDPRLTFGLMYDAAKVLEAHRYPTPAGVDLVELGQALFRFLYTRTEATP